MVFYHIGCGIERFTAKVVFYFELILIQPRTYWIIKIMEKDIVCMFPISPQSLQVSLLSNILQVFLCLSSFSMNIRKSSSESEAVETDPTLVSSSSWLKTSRSSTIYSLFNSYIILLACWVVGALSIFCDVFFCWENHSTNIKISMRNFKVNFSIYDNYTEFHFKKRSLSV